jgi:hypothetical protein
MLSQLRKNIWAKLHFFFIQKTKKITVVRQVPDPNPQGPRYIYRTFCMLRNRIRTFGRVPVPVPFRNSVNKSNLLPVQVPPVRADQPHPRQTLRQAATGGQGDHALLQHLARRPAAQEEEGGARPEPAAGPVHSEVATAPAARR